MALAEVLTFPTDGTDPSDLGARIDQLVAEVAAMTPTAGLHWCAHVRSRIEAAETALLAAIIDADDGDEKRANRMARRKGTSKRESRKRTRRGKAVATNPALGDQLADGSLSGEELDLLAGAAAKSDDDALFDDRLISRIGAAGPDQGKRIIGDWLDDRETATSAAEKYTREHEHRAIWKFTTNDGIPALGFACDEAFRDAVWSQAEVDADRLYRKDGGRDLPLGSHPRTHDQRMFDAFADRLRGSSPASAGSGDSGRPTVVVTVGIDQLTGHDPDKCATQIGTGPIADRVLAKYLAHGDLVGMLFGHQGQPLWLGRKQRRASLAQHLALTIRDKGCVLCAAPAYRCDAHHTIPWKSVLQGHTDIDQLVLLCGSCHRQVHEDKLTVVRDQHNECWTTRPATPNEIAPDRPATVPRE